MPATNFPNGLTNVTAQNITGQLQIPDPSVNHTFFEDFDFYQADDWTVTVVEAGSGDASQALANEDGGVLLLTNDNADNDSAFLQKVGESFLFELGKEMFFKARFKVSDATDSDLVMGLQITDTTPLATTDGVYFQKDAGDANLDFHITKDSTSTSALAIATLEDDTFVTVGFYFNGKDSVKYYASTSSTAPAHLGSLAISNLPDEEELTISFGVQNGEAVAKTMSVDYILASKSRR